MGQLDDAIREHLELKRRHGADDDELAALEDSAFGAPERPGDDEDAEGPGQDETTVMKSEPAESGAVAEPAAEAGAEATPAEQARLEYAHLGDTVAHDALSEPETGAEDATAAEEVKAEDVTAEEVTPEATKAEEVTAEPVPPEQPVVQPTEEHDALEMELFESDDDEEEDFDVGEIEIDLDEPEEESAQEHEVIVDPDPTDPDLGVRGEEDDRASGMVDPDPTDEAETIEPDPAVLEETPEFLKDAPESDELWFEQGKPEDFDFD